MTEDKYATVSVERIRQFTTAAKGYLQMIRDAEPTAYGLALARVDAQRAIDALDRHEALCRAAVEAASLARFAERDRRLELDRQADAL